MSSKEKGILSNSVKKGGHHHSSRYYSTCTEEV